MLVLSSFQPASFFHDACELKSARFFIVLPSLEQICVTHLFLELIKCLVVEIAKLNPEV